MKTALLCTLFLIVGAVAGSSLAGYFVDRIHKRNYAVLAAGDLGSMALQAELIKQGEVATVLQSLEKAIPEQILLIHENDLMRETALADTSTMAAKRFYACTGTAIPTEISEILQHVSLPENACGPQR